MDKTIHGQIYENADVRTERMTHIADALWDEGQYTRASSVYGVTQERDALLARVAQLEAKLAELQSNKHAMAITPEVPEGYDTILGYLAKHWPEILDALDYTDPSATVFDGWWLARLARKQFLSAVYVDAPPVLRACGIVRVRAYPTALLAARFG